MSVVANVIGVSRSNLHERLRGGAQPRRSYHKAQDAAVLPLIQRLVAERPSYGYRRITALLNRTRRADGLDAVNHKRVYRIMAKHGLLLAQRRRDRPERTHDGKVVTIRSNLRWCSDGFEFRCWNGDPVRVAFILDTHDREATAWRAVSGAGISGSDVRDMMLEAVERRFGGCRAPEPVEMLAPLGPWLRHALPGNGQRQRLHRPRDAHLRRPDRPKTLLHACRQPREQRRRRSLRPHDQKRLCARQPLARRRISDEADRRMVRGLQ